jgi:hypothetical protein
MANFFCHVCHFFAPVVPGLSQQWEQLFFIDAQIHFLRQILKGKHLSAFICKLPLDAGFKYVQIFVILFPV